MEQDSHLDPDALNSGDKTVTVPLTEDTDYAIVPLMAQVEYPADGSRTDVLLPENVTLLDYYGEPAQDTTVLHSEYAETSAAATGLYLLTDGDFTAQLVYTAPDGNALTQNLNVVIDRSSTAAPPFSDMRVAPYAGRPTPSVTSGRITKVAKVNATWLIWFNGEPAYCCTHGANGQPNGCPPYSYSHTSTVGADQCNPGDHYGNQIRIWGGLNQLSLDEDGDFPAVFCAEDEAEPSVSDFCEMIYDNLQLYIMQHYPDSRAAALYRRSAEELLNGVQTYTAEAGYYTYIYQPAASGWQTVALIGPAIEGEEPEPEPVPQEYYADWQAPAQTAGGSFDLTFTVNTDKYQLNTLEKVDGAVITVTPSRTGGSVDGGGWQMTPAGAQTITTSGHTQDDNFHLNGGDGSATWTVHYEVSKTSTSTLSGQEGPFTSQAEADAAAEAAKNAAIGQLQNEAQGMVDAAIASARAQLANITFSYDEITIPLGFDSTPGALGSHQTITVPANSSNDYPMKNDEWSVKVSIDKIDSETKQRIKGDAEFKIFEWDTVQQCYIPAGGYNQYKVERQSDGTYKVVNHSDYAGGSDDLFYTQRNEGKFVIVESRAPSGYYGDWTDVTNPGTAGSVLGKRAYAFEITKALDGQTIWLGNADYNADITTANSGGTLIDTGEGVVTITFGSRNADKTYATDPTGIANNEDSYTMHANSDKMQNDRVLGNILLTKVDLDAARYLAVGCNGDTTLEGAVYDLYAADTIEHPDGVSGVVDYSKITDANGTPIWHTTVLTNGGWDTDYLPILQKDRLVASAKITDGKLAFANLYMGRYYLVERATGLVLPIDGNGKLYITGKYPLLNKKLERTGKYSSLATKGGEYIVTVDANSPQSRFTVPAGSVTTASNDYMTFNVLDEELEGYLQLIKTDTETGKTVKIANAAFALYRLDEKDRKTRISMIDPASGNATKKTDVFYTDADGLMKTPEKLPLGRYLIEELQGPEGYYNDPAYSVEFEIKSDRVWQVVGNATNDMDEYIITEKYCNHETLGQVTIRKLGNVLTDYQDGQFIYTQDNLAGTVYEIHAAADIATPDRQGTYWYKDGDLVATVTTGLEGQVDEVKFSPTRTQATYDFLKITHDGTKGEVTVTLPLGKYSITEVQAPYGFVLTQQSYTVEFGWDNQKNDIVLAKTIVSHEQYGDKECSYSIVNVKDASEAHKIGQILVFENARVLPVPEKPGDKVSKIGVGIYKQDREALTYLSSAVYELYTVDDIYSADGTKLLDAGAKLATGTATNANGFAWFDVDVPIRSESYPDSGNSGRYRIVEITAPAGYLLDSTSMEVTFTYEGQQVAWQVVNGTNTNLRTSVDISKQDITNGKELPGAKLEIRDADGSLVEGWTSGKVPHTVRGLELEKEYTLTEKHAPDGYTEAESIVFKLVQEGNEQSNIVYVKSDDDWVKLNDATVIMQDAPVLDIDKTDIAGNLLPGATLTIRDANDEVVDTWTTDYKTHRVPISDEFIKLSGEIKEYIYTLTEDAAPAGFEIAESVQFKLETVDDGISLFVRENADAEWARADKRLIQMIDEATPREDTPTPTPAPTPQPTPAATPAPTPAPTPHKVQTIPQTGDGFPLLAIVVVSLVSATGIVLLTVRQKNALKETSDEEDADESADR